MAQETKKVAIYSLENQNEFANIVINIEDANPELAIKLMKVLRQVQIMDITFGIKESELVETTEV